MLHDRTNKLLQNAGDPCSVGYEQIGDYGEHEQRQQDILSSSSARLSELFCEWSSTGNKSRRFGECGDGKAATRNGQRGFRPGEMEWNKKSSSVPKASDAFSSGSGRGDDYASGEGFSQSYEFSDSCGDLSRSHGGEAADSLTSNMDKKNDMALSLHLFSEDMRISKILRRLCAESNSATAIDLCEKLQQVIRDPSNAAYIRRAFDFLAESLLSVLQQGPVDSLNHVATVFGMLGYVIRLDFPIYKNWIFKNYDAIKGIRIYLMRALKVTIKQDALTLDLSNYSDRLIVTLKDLLECTEAAENFIAVSDVIAEFANNYRKSFEKHFSDIVDIVVGWHLETEQSPQLKRHCSMVLQRVSEFFIKKADFTMGLLSQFLEDIIAFGEDIQNPIAERRSPSFEKSVLPEVSVGSFVGAFNSVLKCLANDQEIRAFFFESNLLDESIETILRVSYQSLRLTMCQETVQSINEYIVLILTYDRNNAIRDVDMVLNIIEREMIGLKTFNDTQISSFLFLLITLVQELKADSPISFITSILCVNNNHFSNLKMSSNPKHYKLLIKLYHKILGIKNVALLQEAYKHILVDMRAAMECIEGSETGLYTIEQAECVLNFYLSAISDLATQTSSIIGMYALQPSILELLIRDLSASNLKVWHKNPVLHDSILKLLAVHCMRNNNYILSSKLFIGNVFSKLSLDELSPTSENFSIILKFMGEILSIGSIPSKILIQLLNWTQFLYQQSIQYAKALKNNPDFVVIGQSICKLSTKLQPSDALECSNCIAILFKYEQLNAEILVSIGDACCINICSTNSEVRDNYCQLFSKLPLDVALKQAYETTGIIKSKDVIVNDLQRWYISSSVSGDLHEKYFKQFFDKIAISDTARFVDCFLLEIFPKCWTLQRGRGGDFCCLARNNLSYLMAWIQWEAAQFCVNNKLRTPLGKPQETFVKIEAIVRDGARILTQKDSSMVKNVESLVANQKHLRVLLGFLEYLEKSIYNAAEGTAFAMPAPEKPARTFFRVNAPTCSEWFNRIRTAVDLVAMHSLEPEMIIRYSEVMLNGLVASEQTTQILFDHTLMLYVWALIKNGESEALCGVYIWAKRVSGKRFNWIKLAAEHAAGHREKAADGYINILQATENDPPLDSHIRDFIADQYVDCLYFTSQWEELKQFIQSESSRSEQRTTVPLISLTYEQLNRIQAFEISGDASLIDLADWDVFDRNEKFSNNCSYHKLLSVTENTLTSIGVAGAEFNESKWTICTKIIQSGIQECLLTKPKDNLNHLIILNHIAHKIREMKLDSGIKTDLESLNVEKIFGSNTLTRILRWADYLVSAHNLDETQTNNLRLNVASIARKEGNLKFSQYELERFFKKTNREMLDSNLNDLCKKLMGSEISKDVWTNDNVRGVYEVSKWLYNQPEKHNEAIQLSATCCLGALARSDGVLENLSRTLLTLSDWLALSSDAILSEETSTPLKRLLNDVPPIETYADEQISAVIPALDVAAGKLIQYSTQQCPALAKAWSSLGSWCYRWGRKIFELRTGGLRSSDIQAIATLIPNGTDFDIDKIVATLNQHQVTADDEEIGPNEISSTELIESQLRSIDILMKVDTETIQSIVEIWRQAHKSVYGYYEMAASAYFKYLTLASSDNSESNGDCSTVTATLRLLRLVVKHALGLQEVLEEGLLATPTRPWKVIIPQLFSRLNHHELYVRKRVSELLCRVAKDSPHLIIFPAVVGAAQENKNEEDEKNSKNNALALCFNSLLDTLSKQAPETVKQVQLLVRELKRVTLLWDEYWLHSLAQLYSEYAELFKTLESDARKYMDEKLDLITEKHRILMGHVVDDMNRLNEVTSRSPETTYERNFQEKYSKLITATIEDLKKPFNPEKPNESSQKIKQLYLVFQQKLQKSSQATLKMIDISPILANMKNTAISMPGVETSENHHIYIKSMDNIVYILPTKTKPKKLAFVGSDGKRYTYLFKGLEDLHLDERIMQFLSIANSMMTKSNDCNGHVTTYRAHHYSVIPLGPRSGLITWVDGVIPIFALYKKWQQREAANPKKDKQFTVMRPSEMFYNKLTPLLAELNIKTTDNRKTWPVPVLRKVLEELSTQTPRDLLAKELWCYSNNAASWRRAIRTYSLSVAVMSVIGYVIGLGDRHLDNVLVKLSTGEIVHIDYNVCFEKGKTLRVPEKVPFRMTPNLEEALGITGIEGTFRLACEHVLKTLRKERETLLTLLEAFVYDPLVDWAVSDDGTTTNTRTTNVLAAAADIVALTATTSAITAAASSSSTSDASALSSSTSERKQSRKKLENEVMRDTLTSRFAEIKPEWTQYRDEVNEQLLHMTQFLDCLEAQRSQMQKDESERDLLTKQMAMIREVETLGTAMSSHPINTLSQRYSAYRKATDEFNQVKDCISEKSRQYANMLETYFATLYQLTEPNINEFQITLGNLCQLEINNEFNFVKDFLENSAQGALYLQADQARKELDASFMQQSYIVKVAIDTLMQYQNVMKYFPENELKNHRFFAYKQFSQEIEQNPAVCQNVLKEFKKVLADEKKIIVKSDDVMAYAFKLEALWIEENFTLRQNCEALQNQITDANELLQDATNSVSRFLENDPGSLKALQCVFLRLLIDTRNQYRAFETSSIQTISDPSLILTEELSYLQLVTDTAKILFQNSNILDTLIPYVEQLTRIRSANQSLKDIELYFKTQIIPTILQTTMAKRSSLANALHRITELQIVFDLDMMLEKLDVGINCDADFNLIVDSMNNIRCSLPAGEIDFFGHIEHLFGTALRSFEECFKAMDVLLSEVNTSDISDPVLKQITLNMYENYTISTLRKKFELQKLKTLIHIIQEAENMANSLLTSDLEAVFDHKILQQPLNRFIYDFECKFIFGMGPYVISLLASELLSSTSMPVVLDLTAIPLDQAIPSAIEQNLILNIFTSTEYAFSQALCVKLCLAIKQKTQFEHLNQVISIQNEIINHIRLVSTAHVWLNEKLWMTPPPFGHIIHKSVLLANYHTAVQNLNAWQISIQKIYDELMSFTRAVVQRLKWAVGANASLTDLQQSFNDCVAKQERKFQQNCKIASTILEYCSTISSYENLKINAKVITENDEQFSSLLRKFGDKFRSHKKSAAVISAVEEGLVQLLDPEGNVDHCWINNASGLLDDMTDAIQRKIASLEKDLVTTQDNLQMSAHKLRSLMDNELVDVRYLLKLILKFDKTSQATKHKRFQNNYKQFLIRIDDLHMKVLSKDFTEEIVKEIRELIDELVIELEEIYNELIRLVVEREDDTGREQRKENKLSGTPIRDNKKGNQPEQKRNAYAVSVWRRIRMKLEGRDPDPNRRLTVAEQVDWMIREAMNPDNLAVLYEGWTPWV